MSDQSRRPWHKWKQFRKLAPRERRLFVEAMGLLPLTALGLRLCGFRRWSAALERLGARPGRTPQALSAEMVANKIRHTLWLLGLAAQHGPYGGNCLTRSLVLRWLLRRQGIESDLRIGTRNSDGQFQAHAWVEYQGHPLNEGQDVYQRYAVFDRAIKPG